MTISSSPIVDVEPIFHRLKAGARTMANSTPAARLERIRKIDTFLHNPANVLDLEAALYADFRKHPVEVMSSEVSSIIQQINHIRKNLRRWMADRRVDSPLTLVGTRSWIRYEAKGVCLILSPWNYPFNLSILPLLYAIAAGNTVLLKPSELAPHTAAFVREMLTKLFPPEEVIVMEGDATLAGKLLALPFDHIYFTGSPQVGKIVMAAAARHLTSVTLELGGKSPAIIGKSAAVRQAAEKCVWAKHFNNGQTCIAPDYLLVHEDIADSFAEAYRDSIRKLYNPGNKGVQQSADYCRIINGKNFTRIRELYDDALAKGARVLAGGEFNEPDRYVAPTLIDQVSDNMRIMEEEIFGPLMPMRTFRNTSEVLDTILARPKPLSLYIASQDKSFIKEIVANTSSGGAVINDYLLGYLNPYLPFGGVNNSGIGKAMGHHSFVDFSNERGIVERRFGTLSFIFPPYNNLKKKLVSFLAFKLS